MSIQALGLSREITKFNFIPNASITIWKVSSVNFTTGLSQKQCSIIAGSAAFCGMHFAVAICNNWHKVKVFLIYFEDNPGAFSLKIKIN